jgi:thiamine biosynthesis lipoprotein
MGGDGEVRVAGREAEPALDAAISEVARIEQKYSRYRPDSVVGRINAAAGTGEAIEVDAETAELLAFAARLWQHSDGAFDITSGVLRQAWDFRSGRLPSRDAIAALLPRIGWDKVSWDGRRIALPRGMELDFGGFGKEYAVDRAVGVLAAAGVPRALVNLGGDLRVLGGPWSLGIRHPRRVDAVIASVELTDAALATSGDYERFLELDGVRFSHILDPRTGWPSTHWQSVSVIAPVCAAAGAATTIAMLLGARGPAFLRTQGLRFLAVDASGQLTREGT